MESEILRIGPIAFPAMDFEWTAALSDFYHTPDEAGRYPAIKVVAVVAGDAIGPVSVSIVEDDRDSAGLVYDSSRWTSMTLDSTDHTVRFEVCSGIDAQFNGGFVITKPTCLRLVVVDEGPYAAREWRSAIPFGVAPDTCV